MSRQRTEWQSNSKGRIRPLRPLNKDALPQEERPTYQCMSTGYHRTRSEIDLDVNEYILESNSFSHNLANVISGINHEVAPWLGGAINTLSRLRRELAKQPCKCDDSSRFHDKWMKKLEGVLGALEQATEVMGAVSYNVKRLKRHTVEKTSILNTVRSWFTVIFVNDTIKGAIEKSQIIIDEPSLSFEVLHSPMLLSQVFLNLVKNSIDHNPDGLEDLRIRLYGRGEELIIEDNGRGVRKDLLENLFVAEVTTKTDGGIHGLGLAICKEYCSIMGADLSAEQAEPHGLRLCIRFAQDLTE